jgi:hypothetical protein
MLAQAPVLQAGACVAWSLQTAIHTLDHSELILSEGDTDYVCEHIQSFLLHWQGLFQIFHAAELPLEIQTETSLFRRNDDANPQD